MVRYGDHDMEDGNPREPKDPRSSRTGNIPVSPVRAGSQTEVVAGHGEQGFGEHDMKDGDPRRSII